MTAPPSPDAPAASPTTLRWPALLRLRPRTVLIAAACLVGAAWTAFIAVDIGNAGGLADNLPKPMWTYLFNDHVVEVSQWFVLALLIPSAGYLAGRLAGTGVAGAGTFFFLLAVGLGLMMVEDAGDVRHGISGAVLLHAGETVAGLPYQVVSDVPYFAALAAIPIYAVLRYGRHAWQVPAVRPYLVAAVGLYATAAIGSGLRHLGGLYTNLGSALDRWLLGGRFPAAPEQTQERAHYMLIDGPVEESLELLAVACMAAVVLAFAAHMRRGATGDQTGARANVPAPRRDPDEQDQPAPVS